MHCCLSFVQAGGLGFISWDSIGGGSSGALRSVREAGTEEDSGFRGFGRFSVCWAEESP